MSRCTEVHPHTKRRCILEEGHLEEKHDPEPYTPEERHAMVESMRADVSELLDRWLKAGYPGYAMSGCMLAHFLCIARDGECQSNDNIIRAAVGAVAGKCLDDHDIFVYIAEQLGVSCSVLNLPAQQRGQA